MSKHVVCGISVAVPLSPLPTPAMASPPKNLENSNSATCPSTCHPATACRLSLMVIGSDEMKRAGKTNIGTGGGGRRGNCVNGKTVVKNVTESLLSSLSLLFSISISL